MFKFKFALVLNLSVYLIEIIKKVALLPRKNKKTRKLLVPKFGPVFREEIKQSRHQKQ